MRKFIHRGKRTDNQKWETGSLVVIRGDCSDEKVYIADKMTGYLTPVDADTVGEYTGLTDKKDKMIFEGDYCLYKNGDGDHTLYLVEWLDNGWKVQAQINGVMPDDFDEYFAERCKVIGNIHDNADMLWATGEDSGNAAAGGLLSAT